MESYEEKFIVSNKNGNQNNLINIVLSFVIFLAVFTLIFSLHIKNLKNENNAKEIISESISWFADIENTAKYLLNERNKEILLDESNLNNYIPIANVSFGKSQKDLQVNDLTTYLQTSMTNELYTLGSQAFTDSTVELSYRENKNRYLIYNFYNLLSKKSLETFNIMSQIAIFVFFVMSIGLIWSNFKKAFLLIGTSVCSAAFPLLAFGLGIKIIMNVLFPINDLTQFYQNYVNQFASHIQITSITIFIFGLILIAIGWLVNYLLVNNSID